MVLHAIGLCNMQHSTVSTSSHAPRCPQLGQYRHQPRGTTGCRKEPMAGDEIDGAHFHPQVLLVSQQFRPVTGECPVASGPCIDDPPEWLWLCATRGNQTGLTKTMTASTPPTRLHPPSRCKAKASAMAPITPAISSRCLSQGRSGTSADCC